MIDDEIGYARPPQHTRFKKGVSGNPKGRPKKDALTTAAIHKRFMDERIDYVERGKKKSATRRELAVRRMVAGAVKGDLQCIEQILTLRQHCEKGGGAADEVIIRIEGGLPKRPAVEEKRSISAGSITTNAEEFSEG